MFSRQRLPALIIAICSALYVLAVAVPLSSSASLWGVNLLGYFSWSIRLSVALGAIGGAFGVILLGTTLDLRGRLRKTLLYLIIPAILLVVFYLLRVKTHYLGDGILRIRELEIGVWWLPTEPLAQAANYLIYKITSILFGWSATAAVETASYLAGLLYYFALLAFVKSVVRNKAMRLVSFIMLYFSGMTVLFCGYAETYMFLPGLMALFFAAGVNAARSKSSPLPALLLFLLLTFFHFKSLMLIPSVAFIGYVCYKDGRRQWASAAVISIAVALVGAVLIPKLSSLPILSASGFLLPLAAGGAEYGLFSTQHLLDIVNQLLLTSAAAVIVLFASLTIRAKQPFWSDRSLVFVASALPGAAVMLVLLHSRLGYAVDWDLYSSATLVLSFFAAMILISFERVLVGRVAAIALAAVSLISFSAFAAVNANFEIAVQRQVDVLGLYGKEGAIGFESMGNHLNSIGKPELAERMWRKSLFLRPHARTYANLAQLSLNEGRITDAKYYSEKGLALDSTNAALWNHHGVALTRFGDRPAAERSLLNALHYDPNDANYHHNYSIMLTQSQRWSEAEAQSREALRLRPNDITIMTGLGIALTNSGKLAEAESVLRQITSIAPSYGESYFYLGRVYLLQSDTAKVRQTLSEYVRRYPNSPTVPRINRVLEGLP